MPNENMKGGCIDMQNSSNPSKAATDGLAGPKHVLAASPNLSNSDALTHQVSTPENMQAARRGDPNTTAPEEGPESWAAPGQ